MVKKLSLAKTKRFDPVDFVSAFVHNKGRPAAMKAGQFSIERDGTTIKFNEALAAEFAKEAIIYKNFWVAASDFARVIEAKAEGQYIDPQLEEQVKDTYLTWRNACVDLDIVDLDPNVSTEKH